ncbi:MAG TPA: L-dopachrome tautomerase-related protein [Humisphaera sp.]|jgi:sugar lactone lactonase YvrE|nr:L-dopachrome tautomerase-related protein [Humisphaera sp.]
MRKSGLFVSITGLICLVLGCAHDTQHGGREQVKAPRNNQGDQAELASARIPPSEDVGNVETIAYFNGPMPTGVTVSHSGRIFVSYPKWGDPVKFTVAEIKEGQAVAYPSERYNTFNRADPGHSLVSVQSVVIDPRDRLWLLDTGSINMGNVRPGAAKLVCVDLGSGDVIKTITFSPTVVFPTTYINDVRFDLTRGKEGMAFITDSSATGPNGIIVVDLDSQKSWRRLTNHPSTKADPTFSATVEGKPLTGPKMGSDGIAISNDGSRLFYCPLSSRHLYSVSVDALVDQRQSDPEVAGTVQDLGDRGFASDGLETDSQGRLYLTDYEHNAIRMRDTGGTYSIIASNSKIIWPDTLSISSDQYLYFTNNQLNRMARMNNGVDERKPPYTLMRVKIDGAPIMRGASAGRE